MDETPLGIGSGILRDLVTGAIQRQGNQQLDEGMQEAGPAGEKFNAGDIIEAFDSADEKLEAGPSQAPNFQNDAKKLNHEILETLFELCPVSYLSNFRFVCKEWAEAGLQAWRKKATLTVVNFIEAKGPQKVVFVKYLNLPDLISLINDPDEDPLKLQADKNYQYRKFKLETWYLTFKNPNMVRFWQYFGSSIHYLELANLRVDKMDTILGVLYLDLPNMRTLVLNKLFVNKAAAVCEYGTLFNTLLPVQSLKILKVRNLKHFPVDWVAFLDHFPCIEVLESFNIRNDREIGGILLAIEVIRLENPCYLSLKSLSIIRSDARKNCVQVPFTPQSRKHLSDSELPIKELHLKMGVRNKCGITREIIDVFKNNLTKLTCHVDYGCSKPYHKFPYLVSFPVLEELELFQWCEPATKLHTLIKSMPSLSVLRVKGARNFFKHQYKNLTGMSVSVSLKDFSFIEFYVNVTSFKYLVFLAPNLSKLELKMNNEIFRMICLNYPNLIELRVSGNALTDEGVVGKYEVNGNLEKLYINITNLQQLRVFVLHNTNHQLTDKSVFDGFLKIRSLFTLQISLPENQMSAEAGHALEQRIPNFVKMREQKCSGLKPTIPMAGPSSEVNKPKSRGKISSDQQDYNSDSSDGNKTIDAADHDDWGSKEDSDWDDEAAVPKRLAEVDLENEEVEEDYEELEDSFS